MASSWILDLVVKEAEMGPGLENLQTPLWFILTADGLNQQIPTTQAIPCKKPKWDFPARMILTLSDISRAYLYVTLTTFNVGANGTYALARSRIGLRSLPIGSPKTFKFPLMQSSNGANVAATVTFVATLSQFIPKTNRTPVVAGSCGSGCRPYVYPQEMFYGSRT